MNIKLFKPAVTVRLSAFFCINGLDSRGLYPMLNAPAEERFPLVIKVSQAQIIGYLIRIAHGIITSFVTAYSRSGYYGITNILSHYTTTDRDSSHSLNSPTDWLLRRLKIGCKRTCVQNSFAFFIKLHCGTTS